MDKKIDEPEKPEQLNTIDEKYQEGALFFLSCLLVILFTIAMMTLLSIWREDYNQKFTRLLSAITWTLFFPVVYLVWHVWDFTKCRQCRTVFVVDVNILIIKVFAIMCLSCLLFFILF